MAKQDRLSGNSTFANGEGTEKRSHGELVESWVGRKDNNAVDFERRSSFISYLRQHYPEEEAALVSLRYHRRGQI